MESWLEEAVRQRAHERCEYCLMPQAIYRQRFQIDHVIARQHGGATTRENLALACMHCNRHKGPNIAGLHPHTNVIHPLFNPRNDKWAEHFRWEGPNAVGITPTGAVTIIVLAMNHPDLVAVRDSLIREGAFP